MSYRQYGVRWNRKDSDGVLFTPQISKLDAEEVAALYKDQRGTVVVSRLVGDWEVE